VFFVVGPAAEKRMPAGLWVVLYACQAAPVGAAWVKAVILPLSAGGAAYCVRV